MYELADARAAARRRRDSEDLLDTASIGCAGDRRARVAGRRRREADGAVVEGGFQGWRATPAAEAFAKKAGVAVDALEKVTTAERRVCWRDGEARRQGCCRDFDDRFAEGSTRNLLGEEYVLARGEAGAVCAAGALGCRDDGCCRGVAGDRRDQSFECEPRTSHFAWRCSGGDRIVRRNMPRRCAALALSLTSASGGR